MHILYFVSLLMGSLIFFIKTLPITIMLPLMFLIVLLIPMGLNELDYLKDDKKEYLYRNRYLYWLFGNLLFVYFLIKNLEFPVENLLVYILFSIVVIKYATYKMKKNTFIKYRYVNSKIKKEELQFFGNEIPNGMIFIFMPIYIYMVINIEDFTINGFNKSVYLSMFIFFIVVLVERYVNEKREAAKDNNKVDISKKKYLIKTNKSANFIEIFKKWELFLDENYAKDIVLIVEDMKEAESYIHLSMDVVVSYRKEDIEDLLGKKKKLISFYFDNDKCNKKILAYKGLKHVLINKGLDFKELEYDNMYSKCDYIFVSGEEALNKYIKFDSDINKESLKIIGIPNEKQKIEKFLKEDIEEESEEVIEESINIIYIPTWEGVSEDRNNSSMLKLEELLELLREDIMNEKVVLTIRFNELVGSRDYDYVEQITYAQRFYLEMNKELFDIGLDEDISIEDFKNLSVFKGKAKKEVEYSSTDSIYDDLKGKDIVIADMSEEIEQIRSLDKSIYVMNMKEIDNEEYAKKYDYIKNIIPIKDFKEIVLKKDKENIDNELLERIKEKDLFETALLNINKK